MPLAAATLNALRAAAMGLGGAPLGNLFRPVSDSDAEAVLRRAIGAGIRYFDTAPHYGHGRSEQRMGAILRERPRDDFLLSTKIGRLLSPDAGAPTAAHGYVDVLPFAQRYDYSYGGTLRSLDESLHRLGLNRVDIAYVHDVDVKTHGSEQPRRFREAITGALPALAKRKEEGALAGFGLGLNDVQVCLDTLSVADVDAILLAGRYTLADQSALARLLPECLRRNVAVVAGGVLNSGILATGSRPADGSPPLFDYAPASSEVVARVQALEEVCDAFAVPLQAAALQFPSAHPAITCIVVGARSTAELDANLAWLRHPIPPDFWSLLRARGLIDPAAPLPCDPQPRWP